MKQAEGIYDVLKKIIDTSEKENIPTHYASNKIAEERVRRICNIRKIYSGNTIPSGKR